MSPSLCVSYPHRVHLLLAMTRPILTRSAAATLANMLEKFSYENRAEGRPGWVPLAFHEAGVAWDVIFGVFDELLTAKVSHLLRLRSPSRLREL